MGPNPLPGLSEDDEAGTLFDRVERDAGRVGVPDADDLRNDRQPPRDHQRGRACFPGGRGGRREIPEESHLQLPERDPNPSILRMLPEHACLLSVLREPERGRPRSQFPARLLFKDQRVLTFRDPRSPATLQVADVLVGKQLRHPETLQTPGRRPRSQEDSRRRIRPRPLISNIDPRADREETTRRSGATRQVLAEPDTGGLPDFPFDPDVRFARPGTPSSSSPARCRPRTCRSGPRGPRSDRP